MAKEQASYLHGHHESVVKDHARRTAQDSAAFLLPHIKPHHTILDLGCGPGTITADFASIVSQGKVVGGDAVQAVLDEARQNAQSRGLTNITFRLLDANDLPYPDNSFDIVHCHQVLQHVQDPVGILKEMRRVAKADGIVAARETDYGSFAWYPELPGLDDWKRLYYKAGKASKGEPNAGRRLHVWAKQAGFEPSCIDASWDTWHYSGQRAIQFGEAWAGRVLNSNFAGTILKHGLASQLDIERISQTWKDWAASDDLLMLIPCGQILCRK